MGIHNEYFVVGNSWSSKILNGNSLFAVVIACATGIILFLVRFFCEFVKWSMYASLEYDEICFFFFFCEGWNFFSNILFYFLNCTSERSMKEVSKADCYVFLSNCVRNVRFQISFMAQFCKRLSRHVSHFLLLNFS